MTLNEAVGKVSNACDSDAVECLWDFDKQCFRHSTFQEIVSGSYERVSSCFVFTAGILMSIEDEKEDGSMPSISDDALARIILDIQHAIHA